MKINLNLNTEAFREHTTMFRKRFGKNPRFLFVINNIADDYNPEGMPWVVSGNNIAIGNMEHDSRYLGYAYSLANSLLTPQEYANTLFPSTALSIVEFNEHLLEESAEDDIVTVCGVCRCNFIPVGPIGAMLVFDNLAMHFTQCSKEDIADLYRGCYIEAVRTQKHDPKIAIRELRFDFPVYEWQRTDTGIEFTNPVKEFEKPDGTSDLGLTMLTLRKVITNGDTEDRFSPDYNPHNLRAMRLLPTDSFSMPQSILDMLKEARLYFYKQSVISRGITLSAAKRKKMRDDCTDMDMRRMLFNRFFSKDGSTIVFFLEDEPVALLEYSTPDNKPIHLRSLYIREPYRKQGFGSWILEQFFAEMYMAPNSIPMIILEMFMGDNANQLAKFYGTHGFSPYGAVMSYCIEKKEFLDLLNSLDT